MELLWYQQNQAAVAEALRQGQRPDLAPTMSSGPLDELVALHDELGIFTALQALTVQRQRGGVPDQLLLRTWATLPFLAAHSFRAATGQLFGASGGVAALGLVALSDARRRQQAAPPSPGPHGPVIPLPSGNAPQRTGAGRGGPGAAVAAGRRAGTLPPPFDPRTGVGD